MKISRLLVPSVLALLVCGASALTAHAAGQVVTQEVREWARKVSAEEKNLTGSSAGNSLVVLYFLNKTGRAELDPLQKGMALMLLTDLAQVPELQVVERVKLQALAEELGLGSSGLVDKGTAPRVGKLIGARWIAGGDFSGRNAPLFETQSRLLDVGTSEVAGEYSVPGTIEGILKTEKEVAFRIIDQLQIRLKPEVAAEIRKPCSTNLRSLDALFRGIDASDRGNYQQAGELYTDALKADPDVCVAAAALHELVQMGGYSERGTAVRMKGAASEATDAAVAEAAASVSSQTSLTNQIAPKEGFRHEPQIAVTPKTPVNIRVNFP